MTNLGPPDPGSIIITPKDLYDDVQTIKTLVTPLPELRADVVELKRQAAAIAPLRKDVDELERAVDHLGERQRRTETRVAWAAGVGTGTGALLGALLPHLMRLAAG